MVHPPSEAKDRKRYTRITFRYSINGDILLLVAMSSDEKRQRHGSALPPSVSLLEESTVPQGVAMESTTYSSETIKRNARSDIIQTSQENERDIRLAAENREHSKQGNYNSNDERHFGSADRFVPTMPSTLANRNINVLDLDDFSGSQFVSNDAEHDQMEEEEGNEKNNTSVQFTNQFLHIDVPATGLKDVSRVKKDLYHDRVQAKNGLMSGLHRAVSSIKVSDSRARVLKGNSLTSAPSMERTRSPRDPSGVTNIRQLSRMLSFKKTKSSSSSTYQAGVTSVVDSNCISPNSNIPQERSSSQEAVPTSRHSRSQIDAKCNTLRAEEVGPGNEQKAGTQLLNSTTQTSDRSLIQRQREGTTQKPSDRRQTIRRIGRNISISRKGQRTTYCGGAEVNRTNAHNISSGTTDGPQQCDVCSSEVPRGGRPSSNTHRPRPCGLCSPEVPRTGGRSSLNQVGRLLSLNRRKAHESMKNRRYQHDAGCKKSQVKEEVSFKKGKHSSLAAIGRAISLSRGKSAIKKLDQGPIHDVQSGIASSGIDSKSNPHAQEISEEKQNQLLAGTKAISVLPDSRRLKANVAIFDGIENCIESVSKDDGMPNPKLKTISRMFSLSRHSITTARPSSTSSIDKNDERFEKIQAAGAVSRSPKMKKETDYEPKLNAIFGKVILSEMTTGQEECTRYARDSAHLRVPVITLGKYAGPVSRSHWHTDVFTLPHNAVRRECIDLYDILVSISQTSKSTAAEDIDDFEQWWSVAYEFFKFYFELERRILFPWVDSAGSHEREVQSALRKMRGMNDKLQEHLAVVDRVWNEKTFKSREEMFAMLYKAVDSFVPRLLNYFEDQEVLLPAIVQNYYKAEERARIGKEIAALLIGEGSRKNRDAPNHRLVLLIRWMDNPKLVRTWTSRYLNSWARNMYPKWYEMFEVQHYRIVKTFQTRRKLLEAALDREAPGVA